MDKESFSLRLSFENKLDGSEEVSEYIRELHSRQWEKLVQSLQVKRVLCLFDKQLGFIRERVLRIIDYEVRGTIGGQMT